MAQALLSPISNAHISFWGHSVRDWLPRLYHCPFPPLSTDGTISSSSILLAQSLQHCIHSQSCSATDLFYQGNSQTLREWLGVAITRTLHQGEDSLLELTKQICAFLQVQARAHAPLWAPLNKQALPQSTPAMLLLELFRFRRPSTLEAASLLRGLQHVSWIRRQDGVCLASGPHLLIMCILSDSTRAVPLRGIPSFRVQSQYGCEFSWSGFCCCVLQRKSVWIPQRVSYPFSRR